MILSAACAKGELSGDRVLPAERPLWYARPSGAMHVALRRQLTAASKTVGEDYERGRAEIDAPRGRLFVGSSDHGLYALRAGDGSTIWRFETIGVVQCEPLYDEDLDMVYFGSHDGALYGVHAADGSLVFRFNSGAEVARKPVVDGETLYFANGADNLFAIDRRTGKERWRVHRTPALGMEISGYAGPAVDSGKVYMAYSDGHVVAYDARDGAERWTPVDLAGEAEQSTGEAPRYLDVDTTPVLDDITPAGSSLTRVVYVASYSGGVFALEAEKGTTIWKNEKITSVTDLVLWDEPLHKPNPDGPYAGGPDVPETKVLLASASTGLSGLDPTTGRVLWRIPVPEGGITAPAPIAGAIMFGTTRYGLFLMSPKNGLVIDAFDTGTGFAQTPATFGTRAFVVSNAGVLYGVHVDPPIETTKEARSADAR